MKILKSIKNLIKKIDEIDAKSRKMYKEKCYSSNPFAFQQNQTYVWVEKLNKFDKCDK